MTVAVRVQETRVFATERGRDWWLAFSEVYERTDRITFVSLSLGGAVCDVACDDEEHARWLAQHMEVQGIPKSALKVIRSTEAADR